MLLVLSTIDNRLASRAKEIFSMFLCAVNFEKEAARDANHRGRFERRRGGKPPGQRNHRELAKKRTFPRDNLLSFAFGSIRYEAERSFLNHISGIGGIAGAE